MSSANTKRIVKNTLMLYIRMFVMTIITLYTTRIVLKALGIQDFGIFNVVGGIVIMISFLNTAMTLSVNRFLAYELGRKDQLKLKNVFNISVTIHFFIALVVLIIAETIGLWFLNTQLNIPANRMGASFWVYQLSILTFIISILRVPYNASIIAHENMSIYAYVSIIEAVLKLFVVYLLLYITFDKLKLYALLTCGVTLIISVFYYLYSKRKYQECNYQFYWNREMFKSLLNYAGLSIYGNMANIFVNQGQNILLNIFFSPITNAARGISFQVNGAVSSFITNIYTAINPQIIKSYAANDREYMLKLVYQSTKLSFFLLLMMSLPLILEMKIILNLWLETVPENTVYFCQLILINSLFFYIATPSIIALQATGKIAAVHLITGSINLLNLLFSYIFLKLGYPSETVFYIQICISFVMSTSVLFIQKSQLDIALIDYFIKVLYPILRVSAIAIIIPYFLWKNFEFGFLRLIIISTVSIISVALTSYFLGIDSEMRNNVKAYLSNTAMFRTINILK